jgi:cytochrome b561
MHIHNTPTSYGIVAKSLHWILAILIIGAWIVGDYAADLPNDAPNKFQLYDLHKSVGMVILMLVIIRLSWRLYDGKAVASEAKNKIIMLAARTVHFLLYVFMFVQPLTGWAMSSAAGYAPNFFGLFTFPALVAQNPEMVHQWSELHEISAYILLGLFTLHVAGALFHHFVLKDNTLRKMTID